MDSNNQNTNQNQTGSNNQNQGLGAGIDLGQFGMVGNQDNNDYLQSIVAGLNATTPPLPQQNYQGQQEQLNMLLKDLNPGPANQAGGAQNLNIQNILGGQPGLNSLGRNDPLQGLMGMPNLIGGVNQDPFAGLGIGLPGFQNLVGNLPLNMPNQPPIQNYGAQPQLNFGGGGGSGFPQRQPGMLVPGSAQHAAAFHAKGPDNQIKIFVGGLAFQTHEADLIEYFKKFGRVDDAIVMRDKQTNRGRGFGFVKIQFENKQKAQEGKNKIVSINQNEAHIINDKRVDVKSADDYVKPQPGQAPLHNIHQHQPGVGGGGYQNQYGPGSQQQDGGVQHREDKFGNQFNDPELNVTKPNPYVTAKKKGDKEVVFEYPKSKIFVGGLDFKLQNEDLKQHFLQHGAIESAVILKDINTGQSRGFGFVTFKDEAVAQDLIQNLHVTNINGRKVDIKSAEPKQASSNQPPPTPPPRKIQNQQWGEDRPSYQSTGPDQGIRRYATMGNYDDQYADRGDQRNTRDRRDSPESSRDGGRNMNNNNNNNNRRDYRDHREYRDDRGSRRNDRGYGGGDRKDTRRRFRSDSDDSNGSSSSYHRSKDRSRKNRGDRDRRGPHHGNQSKPDHFEKDNNNDRDNKRERSKSDR